MPTKRKTKRKVVRKSKPKAGRRRTRPKQGGAGVIDWIYENPKKAAGMGIGAGAWLALGALGNMKTSGVDVIDLGTPLRPNLVYY